MRTPPRLRSPESSLAFRLDPYRFISRHCRALGTDAFEARLLLRRTICVTGPEASRLLYDRERFSRRGAAPPPVQKTLFGVGGVQGLDGEAHLHRRRLFLDATTPEQVSRLAGMVEHAFRHEAVRWARRDRVELYQAVQELLTRAACDWAGVPLTEPEVGDRARDLSLLFDGAGSVGPRHLASRRARIRAEDWAADLVSRLRSGALSAPRGSAAERVASHRGLDGTPLDARTAAVELLNVIRPTVAVSVYVVLAAAALEAHPAWRRHLADDPTLLEPFVQEVRRFYPFFPAIPAIVRRDFAWNGYRFPRDRRVMLDVYGTNHDPRCWDDPDAFDPRRFVGRAIDPHTLIPQGGGDRDTDHRCPGEPVAIALMKVATRFLTTGMRYEVPAQDLAIDFRRLPALPRSRFVVADVVPVDTPARRPGTEARSPLDPG